MKKKSLGYKRLYVLRKYKEGPVIPNLYFENKMDAKAKRDELGDGTVVSIGPDHYRYNESNGGVNQ